MYPQIAYQVCSAVYCQSYYCPRATTAATPAYELGAAQLCSGTEMQYAPVLRLTMLLPDPSSLHLLVDCLPYDISLRVCFELSSTDVEAYGAVSAYALALQCSMLT
eukprot:758244-Rhodomonas_salina.2